MTTQAKINYIYEAQYVIKTSNNPQLAKFLSTLFVNYRSSQASIITSIPGSKVSEIELK